MCLSGFVGRGKKERREEKDISNILLMYTRSIASLNAMGYFFVIYRGMLSRCDQVLLQLCDILFKVHQRDVPLFFCKFDNPT